MADTEFSAYPTTNTIASTDALLVVRGGVPHRFVGALPAVDAGGSLTVIGQMKGGLGATSTGGVLDWNDASNAASGSGPTLLLGTAPHGPGGDAYYHSLNFEYGARGGTGQITQMALPYSVIADYFWWRARYQGDWTGWRQLLVENGAGAFVPASDNVKSMGAAGARFSVVFAGTGVISTSDELTKQQIGPIPDEWLDAWGDVEWRRYKFNDAVEAKGEEARWHIGLIAQHVRDVFAARGLNALAIGLLCHDEWDAVPAQKAVPEKRNKKGEVTQPALPAIAAVPAGDRWSLRYDECQAFEAAWQRRRGDRQDARIADLTARLAALETTQ